VAAQAFPSLSQPAGEAWPLRIAGCATTNHCRTLGQTHVDLAFTLLRTSDTPPCSLPSKVVGTE
jgi:hypothetical protein